MSAKKLTNQQLDIIGQHVAAKGYDKDKAAEIIKKLKPANVAEARKVLDINAEDLLYVVDQPSLGPMVTPGPAVDVETVMQELREECGGCENWSGTDCTLVAPETGCPFIETVPHIKDDKGQEPTKSPTSTTPKVKKPNQVQIIKKVKGKESKMWCNKDQVEALLKDPRVSLA